MTTVEEIRDGLNFLIKEVKEIDALHISPAVEDVVIVTLDANQHIFYADLSMPADLYTTERVARIRAKMKEFLWFENEDGGTLSFFHLT